MSREKLLSPFRYGFIRVEALSHPMPDTWYRYHHAAGWQLVGSWFGSEGCHRLHCHIQWAQSRVEQVCVF